MATNKNALIRYKVLDNCFRNTGRKYFINDLIKECDKVLAEIEPNSNGISRRQIFDDISFMESPEGWSIQLEKRREAKKVYYRYSDIAFSINNMPLNELEIHQLQAAVDILSQFKGMPQFEWIHELLPKLRQGFSSEETGITIIDFDTNQYLKGIENIGELYNAIYYQKVLSVTYQPFQNDIPFEIVIHPYFLKQYNNRWFVFGFNPEQKKHDWNLALDRIVKIKEATGKYQVNNVIDWTEYFEDIIGVTKPIDKKVEIVKLQFFGVTGKYIESKPIHGSQKSRWLDDNTLEVSLEIIINYELERLILSYADSVLVLEPSNLIHSIKNRIDQASIRYNK